MSVPSLPATTNRTQRKTIDEVLDSARGRLVRLTPAQAQNARDGGAVVVDIRPAARELSAGTLRQFGTKHVHRVTNNDLVPAVSLHVYAPALVEMNQYRPAGDLLQLSESQLVGLNW